jgi:hypothetical protein
MQLKMLSHSEWEKLLVSRPELADLPNDNPGLVQAVNEVKVSSTAYFHSKLIITFLEPKSDLWECCIQPARQPWIGFRVDH